MSSNHDLYDESGNYLIKSKELGDLFTLTINSKEHFKAEAEIKLKCIIKNSTLAFNQERMVKILSHGSIKDINNINELKARFNYSIAIRERIGNKEILDTLSASLNKYFEVATKKSY